MSSFKIGDRVRRVSVRNGGEGWMLPPGATGTVCLLRERGFGPGRTQPGIGLCNVVGAEGAVPDCVTHDPQWFELVVEDVHPVAEKPARRSLRARMFRLVVDAYQAGADGNGWTGKEFAELLDAPLNSVTPRLAELRKAGTIKAHPHMRRDGQIVWIIA